MSDRDLKIRVLLDAVDRITRPLRDVVGGAGAAGRAVKAAREEVRRLEKAGRDLSTFKQLRTQTQVGGAALDRYAAKIADIEARMRAAGGPTRALSAEMRRVSGEARTAAEALATDTRRLDELEARLRGAGHDVDDLAGSERKLAAELTTANRALEVQAARMGRIRESRERAGRMKELSGQVAGAGAGLLGAGVALAAPIVLASKAAMGFEEHMADVKKVVNFPTPRSFDDFRASILALSGELPLTADQLGDIAAEAARAGVPLKDLLSHTRTAAKMQIAFDLKGDPAQAGAILAAWRNAFGFEEEGIQHLGDQINALTNKWGGHADAVAEVVTRVGPLAKVSGLGAGQTAALASVLASMNVNSDVAATGIKNLMLRLGGGEAATKGQKKAFGALGLEAVQMAKLMTTDASGAIQMVMDKLHGLDKYRQNAVLTELVGRESIEPIGMLASRIERVRDALKLVEDQKAVGGSMDAEYASRAGTTANALNLLKNNATAVAVEVGYTLLPIIKAVAGFLANAARNIRDLAHAHPELARMIAVVAGVMGGLLLVLGGLGVAVGAVLVPLSALAVVAGLLDIGLLPLIGIVLAVVAAVGLLAAGAVWVATHWKQIPGMFGRYLGEVKQHFVRLFAWFTDIPARFREIGHNIMQGLRSGVMGGAGMAVAAVIDVGGAVISGTKKKLGIHSPSRVFAELGGYIMAGLGVGLRRGADDPLAAILATARKATAALTIAGTVGAAAPAVARAALRPDGTPALAPARPAPLRPAASGGQAGGGGGPTFVFSPTIQGASMSEAELMRLFEQWARGEARRRAAAADSRLSDGYEGGGL